MNKIKLLFPTLLLLLCTAQSQPSLQWQRCMGGSLSDGAWCIRETTDSGYVVAGWTRSNDFDVTNHYGPTNTSDCWIIKLDAFGSTQWQRCMGGSGNDEARSIRQTTDGGYVVAATTASNDSDVTNQHDISNHDYWIVRLNPSGNILWQKALGGVSDDIASDVLQTKDGGFIIAGSSRSTDGDVTGNHGDLDYWMVKLDSTGNVSWQKSYGGSSADYLNSVNMTYDGGFILCGSSMSWNGDVTVHLGSEDYWIVKTDSLGNIQWEKTYGGIYDDAAHCIQQTKDSGYIIAGYSNSVSGNVIGSHGGDEYWIVKLDTSGNFLWQECLGGNDVDDGLSICETSDGGFIVSGQSASNNGNITSHHGTSFNYDNWVVKLSSSGAVQWQKSLGGSDNDVGISIKQTSDNSFIVAGTSISNDGDVSGYHGTLGHPDVWIVKLSAWVGLDEPVFAEYNLQVKPNPAIPTSKVSFKLLNYGSVSVRLADVTGRFLCTLFNGKLGPGVHSFILNSAKLPPGMYDLILQTDSGKQTLIVAIVE